MQVEKDPNGPLLSVQDVHNAIREHLVALDKLWPDSDRYGPRKVHIVELIDAIKLRLIQRAEANMDKYVSPFEKAAQKIMGKPPASQVSPVASPMAHVEAKSAMHVAMEEARNRISRNSR